MENLPVPGPRKRTPGGRSLVWEDYKKDFLAFLGWYLYPYKKS